MAKQAGYQQHKYAKVCHYNTTVMTVMIHMNSFVCVFVCVCIVYVVVCPIKLLSTMKKINSQQLYIHTIRTRPNIYMYYMNH
jgi:hypothetical protein